MPALHVHRVEEYMRMVLNYLWLDVNRVDNMDTRKKGRHRSLIRQIGTRLPLRPVKRAHFHIVEQRYQSTAGQKLRRPQFIEDDCEPVFIASLADVPWLETCSPNWKARGRSEYRPPVRRLSTSFRTPRRRTCLLRRPRDPDIDELPEATPSRDPLPMSSLFPEASTPMQGDAVALKKIGQLEDELSQLRAQIALIVTLQSQQAAVPSISVPVAPPCPGSFPPPPPPPPPVAPIQFTSVAEHIRQNRAKKNAGRKSTSSKSPTAAKKPDMADILKGLGTVKLRMVARSPGGTPVRRKPKPSEANDPATLIAQALRRKFARQRMEESPDKENRVLVFTPSPKKSPQNQSPKFGQHLLKSSKNLHGTRPIRPLCQVNV